MNEYILTLSEKQAHTVIIALQGFIALRNNDWTSFISDICTDKRQTDSTLKVLEEIMSNACNDVPDWDKAACRSAQNIINKTCASSVILKEDELRFLQNALEEYFRIRLNQWFDFTTDVATAGYVYDKANPDNDKLFDEYIRRRNKAYDRFTTEVNKVRTWNTPQTAAMQRAQDVWQVIRNRLYLDNGGDPNGWNVAARTPMSVSGEFLPKILIQKE